MIEVRIFTVVVAQPEAPSVVVLVEKGSAADTAIPPNQPLSNQIGIASPQLLPIWIGRSEAEAIMFLLENQEHARPLTHDLLANVIGSLGSKVKHVVIDKVVGTTFFANVCLDRDGRLINIDARPSDSIALALRTGASIFVDEDVANAAARQFSLKVSDGGELLNGSEDEVERFHSFIESISPEDFSL